VEIMYYVRGAGMIVLGPVVALAGEVSARSRAKGLAVAAALLLTVAACGGDEKAPAPSAGHTLASLASAVGCGGLEHDKDPQLFVREQGSCTIAAHQVKLYTFGDTGSRDSWLKVAQGFGGVYVVGERWVVSVDEQETAELVRGLVGGDIR
jgi:hypothetical protein